MKKTVHRIISIIISVIIMFPVISTNAQNIQIENTWESKISKDLLEEMIKKTNADLIPICIWLNDIDHDVVSKALIEEKGMDPAIYENESRFMSEVVPSIEAQLVSKVGYEVAHKVVEASELILDENGAYHDDTLSLVDRAIQAKMNEYILAKRSISKREHSEFNEKFIDKYVNKDRKIIDIGKYVTRVIVEATKEEIKKYASLQEVSNISIYIDYKATDCTAIALDQVDAGYDGTKGNLYNNGNGYKGTGIKIGIIETGQYDSTCPHLSSISGSRLFFINDAGSNTDGSGITPVISEHATLVTSIIVGQSVTAEGETYEGVVPLATVYQTPIIYFSELYRALQNMADRGVSVINLSLGFDTDTSYGEIDRAIDEFVYETGITVVVAAGNDPKILKSPGKALNVITVGNAETISLSGVTITDEMLLPYNMKSTSAYLQDIYLPSKPNVSAPGTNIKIVKDNTIPSNPEYIINSGTSFAAPIVTGIVAQIQQAGANGFRYWPSLVKSVLVTGADATKIANSLTSPADQQNFMLGFNCLWYKSGAGLVNSENSIKIAKAVFQWNYFRFTTEGQIANSDTKYFSSGQHLRLSLTFGKGNGNLITNPSDLNGVILQLVGPDGNIVYSITPQINSETILRDNVLVIDYTIPRDGNYNFRVTSENFVESDIYYYYSWWVD